LKRALLVLLAIGAFAGLLYATTLAQSGAECEACMSFNGRDMCRSVRAATRDAAAQRAVQNACAILTSGVSAVIKCQASAPRSLRCRED
jgi:hypothetical protein